jgi:hypothetical protein
MSIEQEFCCPLTGVLMSDPVMAPDGHTYEKAAIEAWLGVAPVSPLTQQAMSTAELIPNGTLRMMWALRSG